MTTGGIVLEESLTPTVFLLFGEWTTFRVCLFGNCLSSFEESATSIIFFFFFHFLKMNQAGKCNCHSLNYAATKKTPKTKQKNTNGICYGIFSDIASHDVRLPEAELHCNCLQSQRVFLIESAAAKRLHFATSRSLPRQISLDLLN